MINNNNLDNKDKRLLSFLKNNAPDIPKASKDLEDRIMKSISIEESVPIYEKGLADKLKKFFNPYLFIPASVAIAALFIVAIVIPSKKNSVEMSETASFVEYVWETGFKDYWDDDLTVEINEIMEL